MKNLIYILVIFISSSVSAQEWRDSLKVARDAYKNKEYSKAMRYYQSAQKKAPDNIDLSDEIGQSAYKAREFEKAEKVYQQSAGSKNSKAEKSRTYHNMGNARMKKKDYAGAVESYKEALRNNPNDEQTRYNLSEAIRRMKDEQKKQNQNDNQNNPPPKNGNDKNKPQDNKGENQPQKGQNQPQNNSGGKNGNDKKNSGNQSRLPNKSVERMLDQLAKAEAETKRRMGGSRQDGIANNSGKDW